MQKVSLEYVYFLWKPELVKLCVMAPWTCAWFIKWVGGPVRDQGGGGGGGWWCMIATYYIILINATSAQWLWLWWCKWHVTDNNNYQWIFCSLYHSVSAVTAYISLSFDISIILAQTAYFWMNEKSLFFCLLITAALHGVVYHSYLGLNSRKNVEGRHEVVSQKT